MFHIFGFTLWTVGAFGIIAETEDTNKPSSDRVLTPYAISLSVSDVEESTTWYETILGFKRVREMRDDERGIHLIFLEGPGFSLELLQLEKAVSLGSGNPDWVAKRYLTHGVFKFGFLTKNAKAMYEDLKKRGVTMRGRFIEDQNFQMMYFLIEDPDNNVIQIFQPMPQADN